MHILIGALLALGLLWAWLSGHWFARVVMFLVLALCFGAAGGALMNNPHAANGGDPAIIGAILGFALAWPVSGLPVYYWRNEIRKMAG
jgi:hypothetical protein